MSTRGIKDRVRWGLVLSLLAGLATVGTLVRPASAAVGVLKVATGFNEDAGEIYTPYILAGDYSIRRTWGYECSSGWETVLTGLPYTLDLAIAGDICILYGVGTGPLWCYNEYGGGWRYLPEPSGATFVKLASGGGGRLFAATAAGDIYQYCEGDLWCSEGWSVYASGVQAKELATVQWDGDSIFFLAPPNNYAYSAKSVSWAGGPVTTYGSPRGTKIAVDSNYWPWATNGGGTIYRWNGSGWTSALSAGAVYDMDIDHVLSDLLIVSGPAAGSGQTLWSHDLSGGYWYRCPDPV